jgi:hypothetical protein
MHGLLDVALLVFGTIALLYPKSPFTLAMLRHRGPRRDYTVLLRIEIRESAKGFATYAIASWISAAAIHLATRTGAPPPSEGNAALVAIVTCASVGTWFAWQSARAWLTAAFRTSASEDAILHARFACSSAASADVPPGISFDARRIPIPAAPATTVPDVERLLGGRVAVALLALGIAAVLGGAAVISWMLSQAEPMRAIAAPAVVSAVGIAVVALALRVDRVAPRRR